MTKLPEKASIKVTGEDGKITLTHNLPDGVYYIANGQVIFVNGNIVTGPGEVSPTGEVADQVFDLEEMIRESFGNIQSVGRLMGVLADRDLAVYLGELE